MKYISLFIIYFYTYYSASGQPNSVCTSSFKFNRTSQSYLNINPEGSSSLNQLYSTNGFTWECWFKLNGPITNKSLLMSTEDDVLFHDIFLGFGWGSTSNALSFLISDNGISNTITVESSQNLTVGSWYHVAAACDYNNALLSLYLNGTLIATKAIPTSIVNNKLSTNHITQIGNASAKANGIDADIDEVRFWNTVRTQAEIQNNMNSCLQMPQTGLVAYFKGDEGGGILTNSIGNADFTGSLENVTWSQQTPSVICDCPPIPCNNWLNTPSDFSYATVGDLDVVGNKVTVEALINRTEPLNSGIYYGHLVSKHTATYNVNYALLPNGCEITTTGNGYKSTFETCPLQVNKIYHIAMVYDGTSLKFYRNGFLLSQTPCSGNLINNDYATTISQVAGLGYERSQFKGYVNEVRIWNVARTQDQIRAFMDTSLPNPTTQTGLMGYYTFDNLLNKQGNTLYNVTLNGLSAINTTNTLCTFIADSCEISVPVKLTSFIASAQKESIELKWHAEEELNIKEYIIERSVNGINNFIQIGKVNSRGNGLNHNYSFVDNDISTNINYHYRLIMVDYDGSKKYSTISTAKIVGEGFFVNAFPNPTNDIVNLYIDGIKERSINIEVLNNLGQIVQQNKIIVVNNNIQTTIDLKNQPGGIYWINVQTTDHKTIKKIVRL